MKQAVSAVSILVLAALASSGPVEARPSFSANCVQCHSNPVTDRMTVTNYNAITNIGVRLDGQASTAQKTYDVVQGSTVTLSESLLNGVNRYAVELKNFEATGLKNSQANALIWSAPSASAQGWTQRTSSGATYFTSAVFQDTAPRTFNFDLGVGSSTAPDIYELIFAYASPDGDFYQQEKFYLRVVPIPEPSVCALAAFGALGFVGWRRLRSGRRPAK